MPTINSLVNNNSINFSCNYLIDQIINWTFFTRVVNIIASTSKFKKKVKSDSLN